MKFSVWSVSGAWVILLDDEHLAARLGEQAMSNGEWTTLITKTTAMSLVDLSRIAPWIAVVRAPSQDQLLRYRLVRLSDSTNSISDSFDISGAYHSQETMDFAPAIGAHWGVAHLEHAALKVRYELVPANHSIRCQKQGNLGRRKPKSVLPTGAASHVLSSGLQVSVVNAGAQAVLLVRAQDCGLTGREPVEQKFKSKFSAQRWEEIYDEVFDLLGSQQNPVQAELLDSIERQRDLPLVWVAAPQRGTTDCDCYARNMQGTGRVLAMSGAIVESVALAAAIPGTVVQQITRTLPGLDCRLGLADGIRVTSAHVLGQGASTVLESISMNFAVFKVFDGVLPAHFPI